MTWQRCFNIFRLWISSFDHWFGPNLGALTVDLDFDRSHRSSYSKYLYVTPLFLACNKWHSCSDCIHIVHTLKKWHSSCTVIHSVMQSLLWLGKRFASPIKEGPRKKRSKWRETLTVTNSCTGSTSSSAEAPPISPLLGSYSRRATVVALPARINAGSRNKRLKVQLNESEQRKVLY